MPHIAPDAIVEVLSPSDRNEDLEDKIRVYFACGASVVFIVNTDEQTVTVRDASGQRIIGRDGIVSHESLPGFAMPARSLFEGPRPKKST